jgi:hypothetical protein
MPKIIVFLSLLAILFALPLTAEAQQDINFLSAYISVWPEYEYSTDNPGKPNVLVIDQFVLNSQAILPVEIIVKIPATALKPHVVAVGQTLETVTDRGVKFSTSPDGDWIDVQILATAPAIRVEYYDYNLTKNGSSREYIYHWPDTYAVGSLHFELRQPLRSSNMKTTPELVTTEKDAEGFQYREVTVANLPTGAGFTEKISYERDTDTPSSSFLNVQPSAPLDQPVSGQFSLMTYLPWILGGLGFLLVAGGAIWYWLSSRAGSSSKASRRRAAHKKPEGDKDIDEQVYCHQCGKRAQPGDQFCRTCGARLRQGETQ